MISGLLETLKYIWIKIINRNILSITFCLSGAAQNYTESPWSSINWTVKELPANTRLLSKETPPGTGCPPTASPCPVDPPPRVTTACSANNSSSTLRLLSRAAPHSTESCRTDPGIAHHSPQLWNLWDNMLLEGCSIAQKVQSDIRVCFFQLLQISTICLNM